MKIRAPVRAAARHHYIMRMSHPESLVLLLYPAIDGPCSLSSDPPDTHA